MGMDGLARPPLGQPPAGLNGQREAEAVGRGSVGEPHSVVEAEGLDGVVGLEVGADEGVVEEGVGCWDAIEQGGSVGQGVGRWEGEELSEELGGEEVVEVERGFDEEGLELEEMEERAGLLDQRRHSLAQLQCFGGNKHGHGEFEWQLGSGSKIQMLGEGLIAGKFYLSTRFCYESPF